MYISHKSHVRANHGRHTNTQRTHKSTLKRNLREKRSANFYTRQTIGNFLRIICKNLFVCNSSLFPAPITVILTQCVRRVRDTEVVYSWYRREKSVKHTYASRKNHVR